MGSRKYRMRGTDYKSMMVGVMMTSMRKSMNRHSTEVWEMVGSMGDMMDYKELWGMMCRMEKFRMRGLCSNMESGVRELKFEMGELYSNVRYEVRKLLMTKTNKVREMVGIKMKYGVGEQVMTI